ncbi:MAG: hypothetical protein MUC88_15860 [Planctomycetes bacterium]|nr:hypothetical protein [Planctomycetota bacterium]
MKRPGLLIFAMIGFATVPAPAAIRPSFSLDSSAWKATHIVLATEGAALDGKLEVLESWKGSLAPGTSLTVPALASFADEGRRRVYWHGRQDLPEPFVHSVTGAQMVVFLVRANNRPQAASPGSTPDLWRPASRHDAGDFSTSVAWIERGEAYVYRQLTNPGPTRLEREGSAIEMKARIACLTTIQAEFDSARRTRDPIRTVQVFRACLQNQLYEAAGEVIGALGNMADPALAVLRPLLRDIEFYPWHPNVITALVQAGGRAAAADLMGVIQEELGFWSEQAPNLKDGWWNADPADQREWRRLHYGRLLQSLRCYPSPLAAADRDVMVKTRDLWQTTSALAHVGENQVVDVCNALLREDPTSLR